MHWQLFILHSLLLKEFYWSVAQGLNLGRLVVLGFEHILTITWSFNYWGTTTSSTSLHWSKSNLLVKFHLVLEKGKSIQAGCSVVVEAIVVVYGQSVKNSSDGCVFKSACSCKTLQLSCILHQPREMFLFDIMLRFYSILTFTVLYYQPKQKIYPNLLQCTPLSGEIVPQPWVKNLSHSWPRLLPKIYHIIPVHDSALASHFYY